MRRLLLTLALLLAAAPCFAGMGRNITKDAADQTTYVLIVDSTDGTPETGVNASTTGLDLEYVRLGAAAVDLTESNLASASAAHSDGGIFHVGNGVYRVDPPDAAFATGVDQVSIQGTADGMVVLGVTHQLVELPLSDSATFITALTSGAPDIETTVQDAMTAQGYTPANSASLADLLDGGRLDLLVDGIAADTGEIGTAGAGLTNMPWSVAWNAEVESEVNDALAAATALGGLDVSGATVAASGNWNTVVPLSADKNLGYFQLMARSDAGIATDRSTELVELNTDEGSGVGSYASTTDSEQGQRDNVGTAGVGLSAVSGGGAATLLPTATITVTSQTVFTLSTGSADDDAYNTAIAIITDQSTPTQKSFVPIANYVGVTKEITLATAPKFNIASGDDISIVVAGGGDSNFPALTGTGQGNVQTFFNNDGTNTAKTIESVTTPKQVTIEVGGN